MKNRSCGFVRQVRANWAPNMRLQATVGGGLSADRNCLRSPTAPETRRYAGSKAKFSESELRSRLGYCRA
jgi:hypothetical protein